MNLTPIITESTNFHKLYFGIYSFIQLLEIFIRQAGTLRTERKKRETETTLQLPKSAVETPVLKQLLQPLLNSRRMS